MILRILQFCCLPLLLALGRGADDPAPGTPPHPLVWDAMEKVADVKPDVDAVKFEFKVTNTGSAAVEVMQIRPSCGCTVAEMPSTPWIIEPGAQGSFTATIDVKGKFGRLSKAIFVHSTGGAQRLDIVVNIIESEETRRLRNQQLAFVDRQSVFRGECASCHALPTAEKTGGPLFQAACAICHVSEHRAEMVPDLTQPREPRDAAFWEKWISEGKEQTLMPAFAQRHGGPLSAGQIASLVEYALTHFPTQPAKN